MSRCVTKFARNEFVAKSVDLRFHGWHVLCGEPHYTGVEVLLYLKRRNVAKEGPDQGHVHVLHLVLHVNAFLDATEANRDQVVVRHRLGDNGTYVEARNRGVPRLMVGVASLLFITSVPLSSQLDGQFMSALNCLSLVEQNEYRLSDFVGIGLWDPCAASVKLKVAM